MRRIKILLSALMLFCCWCNPAGATTMIWEDLKPINESLSGTGSYDWTHTLPSSAFDSSFAIPPDKVNSASLAIVTKKAVGSNDTVYYVDLDANVLGTLGASGNSAYTTTFDLVGLGVFDTLSFWAIGDELNFRLDYVASGGSNGNGNDDRPLMLVSSLFTLEYMKYVAPPPPPGDDGSDTGPGTGPDGGGITSSPTPVPEPSTVVLLGSGLLGLLYMGRRKIRK